MSKELLNVATQALQYLKEAGINKPHFIKHAEEVIKAAKGEEDNEMKKISRHFDAYLAANEDMSYTKIYVALKNALKENPDQIVENVEVSVKGEMENISLVQDLEFTTVGRFCEMCGIKL